MVFSINCLYFRLFVAPVYSLMERKGLRMRRVFFSFFFLSPKCVFPYKFARPEVSDPVRPVER